MVASDTMTDAFAGLAGIARKKCSIMLEIQRLEKDKRNEQQGYNYASESAVKDTIRPLMAKHHLALFPSITHYERSEYKTGSGGTAYKTIANFDMLWVDAETGFSHVDPYVMEANDNQDKGFSKVTTLGVKYFLLNSFLVSTGDPEDDPDSGDRSGNARPQNQRQQARKGQNQQPSPSQPQPTVRPSQQPSGEPPSTSAGVWANEQNRAALLNSIRKVTVENLSMAEMARLAGIEKPDDDAAWNKKYLKGADAQKAIAAAFEAEMKDTPPAQPKSAQPPASQPAAPFQWDDVTRKQAEQFLYDRFGLTLTIALDMIGKPLDDFTSFHDFTVDVWKAAFGKSTPFFVKQVQYHPGDPSKNGGGYSTFPEVALPMKMYGSSDKFKALGESFDNPEFLDALKAGKPLDLPLVVKVLHKPAGADAKDKSQQVVKLEIDIPF